MSVGISVIFLLIGAVMLYFGAEGLVRGSASVALRYKIAPLVVGLTIVAFGTSSPELVVSVSAALSGSAEIALGNVIGSNVCNIALILGVAALIRPISVEKKFIKSDMLLMIGVSILLIILMLDGEIGRFDGGILASGIIIYNVATLYMARKEEDTSEFTDDLPEPSGSKWKDVAMIVLGLVGLVVGANVFLEGAVSIAKFLGASDLIIGLTVIALGTSLPELATSVVAAIKNEGDISMGNAVGSNIYNVLCILGFAALVHPISAQGVAWVDLGVMLLVAVMIVPLAWTNFTVSRFEGGVLLLVYLGYVYYLSQQMGI